MEKIDSKHPPNAGQGLHRLNDSIYSRFGHYMAWGIVFIAETRIYKFRIQTKFGPIEASSHLLDDAVMDVWRQLDAAYQGEAKDRP